MRLIRLVGYWASTLMVIFALTACSSGKIVVPITLRLSVALTPQELSSFEDGLAKIKATHPEWNILLETVPQSGTIEKINAQLAANELPDVIRVQGLQVQQWIQQKAFLELSSLAEEAEKTSPQRFSLNNFYKGPLAQFEWEGKLWGLPDTAAPEIVYYNKTMFDQAGLDYPTDDWTYEDMRAAAILLTLDDQGRNPTDPQFAADNIQQWGWSNGLTYLWQRALVRGFGGDFCANADCSEMRFTDPQTIRAGEWWATLSYKDHATLYDPYSGGQTGVPGDAFIAGKAAMGYNGFFGVGQINSAGNIDYDIVQPFKGENGQRYTGLSTNGYVISANTEHPEESWELVQELVTNKFLSETWGKTGHAVPALRSAAPSVIDLAHAPANQQAILDAMAYGEVFMPYTASAFEAYGQTMDLFTKMNKGEISVSDAFAQIESIANQTLARDKITP